MTITEALRISRETRETFVRSSGGGWIRWDDAWEYTFSAEELVADDWERCYDSDQVDIGPRDGRG